MTIANSFIKRFLFVLNNEIKLLSRNQILIYASSLYFYIQFV